MQQDLDKLQKVYHLFVESPHETVPIEMLGDLFQFAGYSVSENKLMEIVQECPESGLQFEQFKALCAKLESSELTREEMGATLRKLSTEEGGYIDVNSLLSIFNSSSHSLSEEEINEVLSLFKPNAEGKVSIDYILSILFK